MNRLHLFRRAAWYSSSSSSSVIANKKISHVKWNKEQTIASSLYNIPLPPYDNPRFTEFLCAEFPKRGNKLAIMEGNTSIKRTYADLSRHIQNFAYQLHKDMKLNTESRIAVITPNHSDFFTCVHGILRIGACVIPMNPLYHEEELLYQIRGASIKTIVAAPACLPVVFKAREKEVFDIIVLDDELHPSTNPNTRSFHKMINTPIDVSDKSFPKETPIFEGGNDVCIMPYSSGTTGLPKATMLTHNNMISNVYQMYEPEMKFFKEGDIVISPLPMFHIYAFHVSLSASIYSGIPLITMSKFSLERFCQLVQEYKCTRAHLVPPIILQLAKSHVVDQYNLKSLKVALSAAAPLSSDIETECSERIGCIVKQAWGMTELSPIATMTPDNDLRSKSGTVGIVVANTDMKVISTEDGKDLKCGEEGELCVRGPQVMRGYYNEPKKTKETMTDDGFLKTGDIAKMNEDGFVWITDRLKELIKVRGFQVAPAELEAVVCTHPEVFDAAVIPRLDPERGETPRAYVVLKPNAAKELKEGGEKVRKAKEDNIYKFVEEKVAPHKRLHGGVIFTTEIPKTQSGKILRRHLIAKDRAASA